MMQRYRQSPNDGPMLADEAGAWVKVDDLAPSDAMVERPTSVHGDYVPDECTCETFTTLEATETEVRSALLNAYAKAGTYDKLAKEIGISDEFARQMCQGHRPITGKTLTYLGYHQAPRKYTRPSEARTLEAVATEPDNLVRGSPAYFFVLLKEFADNEDIPRLALPRLARKLSELFHTHPTGDSGALREALAVLCDAVMADIKEAKSRLDADIEKDAPVHPVSAFLTGTAIHVGKARAALSKGEPGK